MYVIKSIMHYVHISLKIIVVIYFKIRLCQAKQASIFLDRILFQFQPVYDQLNIYLTYSCLCYMYAHRLTVKPCIMYIIDKLLCSCCTCCTVYYTSSHISLYYTCQICQSLMLLDMTRLTDFSYFNDNIKYDLCLSNSV